MYLTSSLFNQHHPDKVLWMLITGKSHPFSSYDVSHNKPLTLLSNLSCTHSPLSTSSQNVSDLFVCRCVHVLYDVKMILCLSLWFKLGGSCTLVSRDCLFISMNLTALIALLLACLCAFCGLERSSSVYRRFQSPHV